MDGILEEFYCAVSGGGCGGFMRVRINMALNGVVEVLCPKCGHEHRRAIKKGVLQEDGRNLGKVTEQLCPTIACWSKKAKYPESIRRIKTDQERNAVVIEEDMEDPIEADRRRYLDESEFEKNWNQGDAEQ